MRRLIERYEDGQERTRTKFLWLPKILPRFEGDKHDELRWLEKATWVEKCHSCVYNGLYWTGQHWLDDRPEWPITWDDVELSYNGEVTKRNEHSEPTPKDAHRVS